MSDTTAEKLSRSEAQKNSPVSSQYTSCSDEEVVRRKLTVEDMLDGAGPLIHADDSESSDEEEVQGGQRQIDADAENADARHAHCPLSRRCCLPCTRFIQSHRRLCYALFIIALTFCALVTVGSIAVGLYLSERQQYRDTTITLQVPLNTTYKYNLEGNELTNLVYHKGMTVTMDNYYDSSGLVLVALSNDKPLLNEDNTFERFEHEADPESTIVRYWRNSNNVTGDIQCTGEIEILVRNISSNTKGEITISDYCSNTSKAINCTNEKINVSTITSNATGEGDLTMITICGYNETYSASANFSEPLFHLPNIPIHQLDSRQRKVRIGYRQFASTIANRRPTLYVSTQYIQSNKESVMPITMTIEFEDTWAYIVSFIVIGVLVFLILLLLLFCYYRHSDKQSCAVVCLYYPQ